MNCIVFFNLVEADTERPDPSARSKYKKSTKISLHLKNRKELVYSQISSESDATTVTSDEDMKTCNSLSQNTKLASSMSKVKKNSSKTSSLSSASYNSNSITALSEKSICSKLDFDSQKPLHVEDSTKIKKYSSENSSSLESCSSIKSNSSLTSSSVRTGSSKSKVSSHNTAPGPSSAVCKTKWYVC